LLNILEKPCIRALLPVRRHTDQVNSWGAHPHWGANGLANDACWKHKLAICTIRAIADEQWVFCPQCWQHVHRPIKPTTTSMSCRGVRRSPKSPRAAQQCSDCAQCLGWKKPATNLLTHCKQPASKTAAVFPPLEPRALTHGCRQELV